MNLKLLNKERKCPECGKFTLHNYQEFKRILPNYAVRWLSSNEFICTNCYAEFDEITKEASP